MAVSRDSTCERKPPANGERNDAAPMYTLIDINCPEEKTAGGVIALIIIRLPIVNAGTVKNCRKLAAKSKNGLLASQ